MGLGIPPAGGHNEARAYHRDASGWKIVIDDDISKSGSGANTTLTSVHARTAKDVWASGNVVYHYDGKQWTRESATISGPVWVSPQSHVFVGLLRRF